MPSARITFDSAGLSAVLTSGEVRDAVVSAAERIASAARSAYPAPHSGVIEVDVDEYVASGGNLKGQRAAASVIAKHPAALGMEAKHGILRRAASAGGAS